MQKKPVNLGNNISYIDVYDLGLENRTGTYVLHDEKLTIIETSASPSIPFLLKGMDQLGLQPKDIQYIIVTHIHLDHAGGVGLLLKECPNAQVVVHPRGARHLADPSRLIAGARAVYGSDFDRLYDPIIPIPEDRLLVKHNGEKLQLEKRTLTFYDTPGHAKHHFSIHDSASNGMFTGDTIGVYYRDIESFDFILPSTSPNQFNPDEMLHSLQFIKDLHVSKIFFSHFGMHQHPEVVYQELEKWLPIFMEAGEEIFKQHSTKSLEELTPLITSNLMNKVEAILQQKGIDRTHNVFPILKWDLKVCAMGLADYYIKQANK